MIVEIPDTIGKNPSVNLFQEMSALYSSSHLLVNVRLFIKMCDCDSPNTKVSIVLLLILLLIMTTFEFRLMYERLPIIYYDKALSHVAFFYSK